jgi:hypothetical protein
MGPKSNITESRQGCPAPWANANSLFDKLLLWKPIAARMRGSSRKEFPSNGTLCHRGCPTGGSKHVNGGESVNGPSALEIELFRRSTRARRLQGHSLLHLRRCIRTGMCLPPHTGRNSSVFPLREPVSTSSRRRNHHTTERALSTPQRPPPVAGYLV